MIMGPLYVDGHKSGVRVMDETTEVPGNLTGTYMGDLELLSIVCVVCDSQTNH